MISRVEHDVQKGTCPRKHEMHVTEPWELTTRWSFAVAFCHGTIKAKHRVIDTSRNHHYGKAKNQADHGPTELQLTDRSSAFACAWNEIQGNHNRLCLHIVRLRRP